MARCCAVLTGDSITGTLIFHQVSVVQENYIEDLRYSVDSRMVHAHERLSYKNNFTLLMLTIVI